MTSKEAAYRAPAGEGRSELREKGSRFLGLVVPAVTEDGALEAIEAARRRFPDATHHCWAWRLGPEASERTSDDGEPAGTAGRPILQVLRGPKLSDVVAVVARWFGGTKLGKGGLARAYAAAARQALEGLATVERFPTLELRAAVPYSRLGAVKRLVHPPDVKIVEQSYGEGSEVVLRVRVARVEAIEQALAGLGVVASREPRG